VLASLRTPTVEGPFEIVSLALDPQNRPVFAEFLGLDFYLKRSGVSGARFPHGALQLPGDLRITSDTRADVVGVTFVRDIRTCRPLHDAESVRGRVLLDADHRFAGVDIEMPDSLAEAVLDRYAWTLARGS
jgi:hypothetical protein